MATWLPFAAAQIASATVHGRCLVLILYPCFTFLIGRVRGTTLGSASAGSPRAGFGEGDRSLYALRPKIAGTLWSVNIHSDKSEYQEPKIVWRTGQVRALGH